MTSTCFVPSGVACDSFGGVDQPLEMMGRRLWVGQVILGTAGRKLTLGRNGSMIEVGEKCTLNKLC